jgi:hypothetical protein
MSKITRAKRPGRVAQVVEHLPNKPKIPSTTRQTERETETERKGGREGGTNKGIL